MGAEVVKLEQPGVGDPMRQWGQGSQPTWWRVIGRNKYSVAADLRSEQGQHLARQLIARADILVENFRPGTLERWNLAPEDRSEEHTSERQSLIRTSYAVFCLKHKKHDQDKQRKH